MLHKQLQQKFPLFFHYTVFQLTSSIALLAIQRVLPGQYFYAFWAVTAVRVGFSFMVIHEIFVYAIRPYAGLRDLANLAFRWGAVLMAVITIVVGFSTTVSASLGAVSAIIALERSVRLMQCGMLLFIFLATSHLGIRWRNIGNGIALGFGIFAVTDLVTASAIAHFGKNGGALFSIVRSGMYLASVTVWLGYVVAPQPAHERVEGVYRPLIDRWNQAALSIISARTPMAVDHTYLSDIEKAVENVLAKSATR